MIEAQNGLAAAIVAAAAAASLLLFPQPLPAAAVVLSRFRSGTDCRRSYIVYIVVYGMAFVHNSKNISPAPPAHEEFKARAARAGHCAGERRERAGELARGW